jgi:hypothetical protein
VTLNPGQADEQEFPAKVTGIPRPAGSVIRIQAPNAAGYGDPLERGPEQVREDVLDDFTTVELAREAYGVVFIDEETLEIDREATERRRAELPAKRHWNSLGEYVEEASLVPALTTLSILGNREFEIREGAPA